MPDAAIIQLIETFDFDAGPVAAERCNRGFTLIHAETGVPSLACVASDATDLVLLVTLERTINTNRPRT